MPFCARLGCALLSTSTTNNKSRLAPVPTRTYRSIWFARLRSMGVSHRAGVPTSCSSDADAIRHRPLRLCERRLQAVGETDVEQHAFRQLTSNGLRRQVEYEERLSADHRRERGSLGANARDNRSRAVAEVHGQHRQPVRRRDRICCANRTDTDIQLVESGRVNLRSYGCGRKRWRARGGGIALDQQPFDLCPRTFRSPWVPLLQFQIQGSDPRVRSGCMSREKTAKSFLHQPTNSGPSRVRPDVIPAAVLARWATEQTVGKAAPQLPEPIH